VLYDGYVYIVEDDEFLGMRLELLLEAYGLTVRTFCNGQSFLDFYTPDLQGCLVLDMVLPDMDGFRLLEKLDPHDGMPVILMSAHANSQMILDAITRNIFRFLTKPLDDAKLVQSIVSAVEEDKKNRFSRKLDNLASRMQLLTANEKKVMKRVANGESDGSISQVLNIQETEVRRVRHKMMKKMKARSIVELGQVMLHLNHKSRTAAKAHPFM